jgi:putative transposase
MEISDIKRLKELEAENRKLKQMFAELSVKSHSSSKAWAVQLQ